jgi:Tfp pilus assembly protein FimT
MTLLELAMSMLVIAVLLALSLPLASAVLGRFKVGSARDAFVNTYARARAAAVQYGREARLHLETARGQFWVEVDTGVPGAMQADTIGRVVQLGKEYAGVTMQTETGVDTLCFDARGLAYSGGGCDGHGTFLYFSRWDRVDTIQLSLGGTVVKR